MWNSSVREVKAPRLQRHNSTQVGCGALAGGALVVNRIGLVMQWMWALYVRLVQGLGCCPT